MRTNIIFLGFCTLGLFACKIDGSSLSSGAAVVLDVRCAADTDCPAGFECETEIEHGVDASYCVSHDSNSASTGQCPAGYELEVEHGGTFCKPHGGDDGNSGSGNSGSSTQGAACQSNADCAAGLECEIEVEHGVTTSVCKPHGGGN